MLYNYNFISDVLPKDKTSDLSNRINIKSIKDDGVYIYDSEFGSFVTPTTDFDRVDMVIVDGCIAMIGVLGERNVIPNGNGFVVTFVGKEYIDYVKTFDVGQVVDDEQIKGVRPEKYAEVGENIFPIGRINGVRRPRIGMVLYNNEFGATTQTNQYGVDIVVEKGRVTSVNLEGDSVIPLDGYVLSVHCYDESFKTAKEIKVGDNVNINTEERKYTVSDFSYTGINVPRLENDIILYRNSDHTNTNEYGYEIAINSDGYMINASYAGNIEIPKGGYVLSGHAIGKKTLELAYALGNKVIISENDSSVRVIKTPDYKLKSALNAFEDVKIRYRNAKTSFLNIKYSQIEREIENISSVLESAKKDFYNFEIEDSFSKCDEVILRAEELSYQMIESKRVENRAVWYRCHEKSDEEVLATVQKMKSLNVNAVYIETWYEGFCIGKKVNVKGITQPPRCEGYDALEAFIRIGHENGIEVHAWVENFFVGFYYDDGRNFYNKFFDSYKDKYLIDSKGRDYFHYTTNNNKFIFLNPNDRECRDLILSIYDELITKYDLDGLQLDYIRLPELNYQADDFGYNEDIIEGFVKTTGITKDPRTLDGDDLDKWIQYRCDIITSFAEEVYQLIQKKNKKIWLSAATYPEIALFKRTIMQDVVSFVEIDIFDEIFSMSYGIDNAYVYRSVSDYVEKTRNKTFYSAGLATFLETNARTFADQLPTAQKAGSDGISIFSLMSIHPERYQPQIEKGAFRECAVQNYLLSKTVIEQTKFICERIENIRFISENITDGFSSIVFDGCKKLKTYSESFEINNADYREKVDFCVTVNKMISEIIAEINSSMFASGERDIVISDFTDLQYKINLTKQRLEKRI